MVLKKLLKLLLHLSRWNDFNRLPSLIVNSANIFKIRLFRHFLLVLSVSIAERLIQNGKE